MSLLFSVKENTITYHIQEIYSNEELEEISTTRKIRVVRKEGKRVVTRNIDFYNLDMIISVGYRVNSKRGVSFRKWATAKLKEILLKGFSENQRFERLEQRMTNAEEKIDFFVKTSLPPQQGVFFDGQIFDAYKFVNDIIRLAQKRVVLIDNFVDDTVLTMLDKRKDFVSATIYTKQIPKQLQLDIEKHNQQYREIEINEFKQSHDRFLLIDNDVYMIGASLKDLGKKWFAFCKMEILADEIIAKIKTSLSA